MNDDNTHFFFEGQPDGSYRIRVKASNRYLHEHGSNDKLVSTRYQSNDTYSCFKLLMGGRGQVIARPIPSAPMPPLAGQTSSEVVQKKAVIARPIPSAPMPPLAGQTSSEVDPKKAMMALSQQTKAGSYYTTAQVPVELNSFRLHMLAIGNLGRRDPDFRKKHGEKLATDLSGATVLIPKDPAAGRPDDEVLKIFKQRQTPPYFNDLVLNDALNNAAQFQAEYQASTLRVGHTGPETYNGASMKEFWERAKYFGYTFGMEGEGCGAGSSPTGSPEGWMQSDTHFRPWFNLGHEVREVGLGIAKGTDGVWYTCVISGLRTP